MGQSHCGVSRMSSGLRPGHLTPTSGNLREGLQEGMPALTPKDWRDQPGEGGTGQFVCIKGIPGRRNGGSKDRQREKTQHIQGTLPECQMPRSLPTRYAVAECVQKSEQVKNEARNSLLGRQEAGTGAGREARALHSAGCAVIPGSPKPLWQSLLGKAAST